MVRGPEGSALPAASALATGREWLRAGGGLGLAGLLLVHLGEHHPDLVVGEAAGPLRRDEARPLGGVGREAVEDAADPERHLERRR